LRAGVAKKKSLGRIPFVSAPLQRFKFRSLEKRADKIGRKFCELKDAVDKQKEIAADILYTKEYDRLTDDVDRHLSDACECTGKTKVDSSGSGAAAAKIKADCIKEIAPKFKTKDGKPWKSGTGHSKEPEKLAQYNQQVDKCIEEKA
jgi:hypothetical protein